MTIERSLLQQLLERNTLKVREVELFKAVVSWAENECKRQKLKRDGPVLREILGEQIVKSIRFPAMKHCEFMDVVLDTNILSNKEPSKIMNYIISLEFSGSFCPNAPDGFVVDKRQGCPLRCCRFFRFKNGNIWYNDHFILGVLKKLKLQWTRT